VIKSHVLYRLSYGLERVDNAHPYVGFAGFAQAAKRQNRLKIENRPKALFFAAFATVPP
jgi:hypothetical protein